MRENPSSPRARALRSTLVVWLLPATALAFFTTCTAGAMSTSSYHEAGSAGLAAGTFGAIVVFVAMGLGILKLTLPKVDFLPQSSKPAYSPPPTRLLPSESAGQGLRF